MGTSVNYGFDGCLSDCRLKRLNPVVHVELPERTITDARSRPRSSQSRTVAFERCFAKGFDGQSPRRPGRELIRRARSSVSLARLDARTQVTHHLVDAVFGISDRSQWLSEIFN